MAIVCIPFKYAIVITFLVAATTYVRWHLYVGVNTSEPIEVHRIGYVVSNSFTPESSFMHSCLSRVVVNRYIKKPKMFVRNTIHVQGSDADSALNIMIKLLPEDLSIGQLRKILSNQVTPWTFEEHHKRLSTISGIDVSACTYDVPLRGVLEDPTYIPSVSDIIHMGHELMFCPIVVDTSGVLFHSRGRCLVNRFWKGEIPAIVFVFDSVRYRLQLHNNRGLVRYLDVDTDLKAVLARLYGLHTRRSHRLMNSEVWSSDHDGDSTESDEEVSTLELKRKIGCRTKRYLDPNNNITDTILQNLAQRYDLDCKGQNLTSRVATHEVQHDIPAYNESSKVYEIRSITGFQPGSTGEEDRYLVKWARSSDSTWEPESGLPGPLLAGFQQLLKSRFSTTS